MRRSEAEKLTDFIIEWLCDRNRGELADTFGDMRVRDMVQLKAELELILEHGGKPPNWVA